VYVLIGMTLKEIAIPRLIFNAVRPFHLAPPLFSRLIIFVTAYPTVFTDASGIFLFAMEDCFIKSFERQLPVVL
jgi:C4-dicarboxylate transporter DctM subunit